MSSTRDVVVAEAMSWVGTRYHHLGDIKGVGVDCAMLLVRVFVDLGLVPPIDPRPYSPQWHLNRSEEVFLGWLHGVHAVPVLRPQPGDVAVFRFGRAFSHGAILVRGDHMDGVVVHAARKEGSVMLQSLHEHGLANRPVQWFSVIGEKS